MVLSKILNSDQMLNEKMVPNPSSQATKPDQIQAFPCSSLYFQSTRQRPVRSVKWTKTTPQTPASQKTKCRTTSRRSCCRKQSARFERSARARRQVQPLVKTIGKMAMPANKATTVSVPAIKIEVLAIDTSLGK